ncbi:hypothetical protein N7474_007441 [Penicillium riverlandense]|uniref:uncharacterized protein n=1 Tax=Penicillium riverlandense TaxID=1903569 RepID=UPI00254884B7|nr:uncharacterized protein N7474_007441 [Penicillium riverlandense]KAJ5815664.1 hypothetical protein N7474_007441 [Penicillium riverlandense]
MPPQVLVSGPELRIRLEGGKESYSPGDTVSGCIYRSRPTPSTGTEPTISLHGQSKSEVTQSAGYTRKHFVSCCRFFDTRRTTQSLYPGQPLDIQSDSSGASWPFAITIPEYMDPKAIAASDIKQKQSFLPLSPDTVAAQATPSSFHEPSKGNKAIEGFVEYYLQAKFQFVTQRKTFFSRQYKTESHEAIMPLRVEHFSTGPPMTDFPLKRYTTSKRISSQRLIPGMEDNRLSLSQKAQRFLGSSKIPRLMFEIHFDVPTVLQLDNDNPVPLNICLEPIWKSTSDIVREAPPNFTVEYLVVRIKPTTELPMRTQTFTVVRKPMDVITEDRVASLDTKIQLSLVAEDTGKNPETVDIGKLVNFNWSRAAIRKISTGPNGRKLYPSFITYNIAHRHWLSWELHGVVAGEKVKLDGTHTVKLLPPSSSKQSTSTQLDEAPPPYEKGDN